MGLNPCFVLNDTKCSGCGLCTKVCEGLMLQMNEKNKPFILSEDAWWGRGCWGCQHCMAVCPNGAISIMGKNPENSLLSPGSEAADIVDALIVNRRSCRRYQDRNVDPKLIDNILKILSNTPTGGNRQAVEYTVVKDKDFLKRIWDVAYSKMEEMAKQGIYGFDISPNFYEFLKCSEDSVRPGDCLFCSAPNLFIAHQEIPEESIWASDKVIECGITSAYFELLCAAHGLGAIMMSYAVGVLEKEPEVLEMLGIPSNHCIGVIIGFGYPEIEYARGVQREGVNVIHYLSSQGRISYGCSGGHVAPDENLD